LTKKEVAVEDYRDAWQTTFFLLDQIHVSVESKENSRCYQPTGGVHWEEVSTYEAEATKFLQNMGVNVYQMKFWGNKRFQLSLYRSEIMFVQLFLSVLEKGLAVNVFRYSFLNGTCSSSGILRLSSQNYNVCQDNSLNNKDLCQNLTLVCNKFEEKLILCKIRVIPSNRMQQTSLLIECTKYRTSIEICGESPEHTHELKDALNTAIRVIFEGLGVACTTPNDYHDHYDT